MKIRIFILLLKYFITLDYVEILLLQHYVTSLIRKKYRVLLDLPIKKRLSTNHWLKRKNANELCNNSDYIIYLKWRILFRIV